MWDILECGSLKTMYTEVANLNFSSNGSIDDPLSSLDQEWNEPPAKRLSRTGHHVMSVFLGSIMVFGFINNLVVLILFIKFKTLRTPVNMLLLNISVSDMLVCLCGTTLSFASSLHARWLYGKHGCMWYGFANSCFGEFSKLLRNKIFTKVTMCFSQLHHQSLDASPMRLKKSLCQIVDSFYQPANNQNQLC